MYYFKDNYNGFFMNMDKLKNEKFFFLTAVCEVVSAKGYTTVYAYFVKVLFFSKNYVCWQNIVLFY